MSVLSIPNSFTNGTTINSAPFNANFAAITTWSTAIDFSNVGPAGFYASNITPGTAAQAIFGATATGVGYKFLANDATATPLTISGVTSQSADILDVTLTSGGTNAFKIGSAGAATFGFALTAASLATANGSIAANGNIIGADLKGSGNVHSDGGVVYATSAGGLSNPGVATGDIVAQRDASTGRLWLGGASTNYAWDGGVTSAGNVSLLKGGASIGTFNGGTGVYAASDGRWKENILPLGTSLDIILALKPSSFDWKDKALSDVGFIAQDVQSLIPHAVMTIEDESGKLGMNYTAVIPYLVKAFQEYVAAHP